MENKKSLNFESQKELYRKFSYNTLESLTVLFDAIGRKTPITFDIIFKEKYEKEVKNGNFEGMNEYPEDLIPYFNIQEIIDKIPELSSPELDYMASFIKEGIASIDPDQEAFSILPQLIKCIEVKTNEKGKRLSPLIEDMAEPELIAFFDKKYNVVELEELNNVLQYSTLDNIDEIRRIIREVHARKYIKLTRNYEVAVKSSFYTVERISEKNKDLTYKQLQALHTMIEDVSTNLFLLSIDTEEYDINNLPIDPVNNLLNSIVKEKYDREVEKSYEQHKQLNKNKN